jgi:hypothetical protein
MGKTTSASLDLIEVVVSAVIDQDADLFSQSLQVGKKNTSNPFVQNEATNHIFISSKSPKICGGKFGLKPQPVRSAILIFHSGINVHNCIRRKNNRMRH